MLSEISSRQPLLAADVQSLGSGNYQELHTSYHIPFCRWTMGMTPRFTPWVQKLTFTGRSMYTIDVLSGGKISAQRDVWDAIEDNSYLSLEGIAHVIRQLTNGQVKELAIL